MAKNVHGVTKKMWKKFGKRGQAMFNRLWSVMNWDIRDHMNIPRHVRYKIVWNACFNAGCIEKELTKDNIV